MAQDHFDPDLRIYKDDDGEDVNFVVFLIRGHSTEWKEVKKFIERELGFRVHVLADAFGGYNILDKFRNAIWEDADCAVAVMSGDDHMGAGEVRARQNVIYELGYCQGVFDGYYEDPGVNPVIIIKERSIGFEQLSDLLGTEVLSYDRGGISRTFKKLGKALETLREEMGGEDEWDPE